MRRCTHIIALALVVLMAFGGTAFAAGRTVSGNMPGTRGLVSAATRAAAASALLNTIDKGIRINGCKNARPLVATPGAKASLSSFNLNPLSGTMCTTNWYAEGYTSLFSVAQPLMIETYPEDAEFSTVSVESSNGNIVYFDFDYFSDEYGKDWVALRTGTQSGTARITVTIDGKKAYKTITVKNGLIYASALALYEYDYDEEKYYPLSKKKTIYTGDYMDIAAIATPYNASFASDGRDLEIGLSTVGWFSAVKASSSKESVAVLTANAGYDNDLFSKAPGSSTLTFSAADGGKAKNTLALTVKGVPVESVELGSASAGMQLGTTRTLGCDVEPEDAWDKSLTWSTSNKKVATVDSHGNVTAVGGGTCNIYAKNKASNQSDSIAVTVSYSKAATPDVDYRFFGIGNADYASGKDLPGCANDLEIMAAAYGTEASGASIASAHDQTGEGIRTFLESMASGAGPEDVSIFYYSGHGAAYPDVADRGALVGTDGDIVTVDEVQARLDQVPGTVVVILDSCLSGQFITSKSASPSAKIAQAKSFNQAWISKFSASKATNFSSKALTNSAVKSKYKIITAAAPMEVSWGGDVGWFSYWMGLGIGMDIGWTDEEEPELYYTVDGIYAADKNRDNAVTLTEAYNYIKNGVTSEYSPYYRQTTSYWPANDKTAIFNATADTP